MLKYTVGESWIDSTDRYVLLFILNLKFSQHYLGFILNYTKYEGFETYFHAII